MDCLASFGLDAVGFVFTSSELSKLGKRDSSRFALGRDGLNL